MNNQMLNFFKNSMQSGGNPEQFVMQFLQNQNTPLMNNLLQMAQSGNSSGIEQVARNLCQQKGIDFDKEFQIFRQQLGL